MTSKTTAPEPTKLQLKKTKATKNYTIFEGLGYILYAPKLATEAEELEITLRDVTP